MNEWISVKDRLPESGRYLVYEILAEHSHNCAAYNYPYPCCKINIAYYNVFFKNWQFDSFTDIECNPTHWMPLPLSPFNYEERSKDVQKKIQTMLVYSPPKYGLFDSEKIKNSFPPKEKNNE